MTPPTRERRGPGAATTSSSPGAADTGSRAVKNSPSLGFRGPPPPKARSACGPCGSASRVPRASRVRRAHASPSRPAGTHEVGGRAIVDPASADHEIADHAVADHAVADHAMAERWDQGGGWRVGAGWRARRVRLSGVVGELVLPPVFHLSSGDPRERRRPAARSESSSVATPRAGGRPTATPRTECGRLDTARSRRGEEWMAGRSPRAGPRVPRAGPSITARPAPRARGGCPSARPRARARGRSAPPRRRTWRPRR